MNRLLLVDGSNLLFQMFFGMPARITNAQGKAIQGTLGFIGALLRIIRMTEPTHIAVLFDGEHPSERAAIDAHYKANRTDYSQLPDDETPFSQLPDIRAALDLLHIPHAETTGCETDDWISAYVMRYRDTASILISSFDSDFFQLISDRVSVLRYRGKKTTVFTPEDIQTRFGIDPPQYADFKSLTGDPSDNIKGADHIGPKTAAALLKQFGTLEQIIANAALIARPAVRASIEQHADKLLQNKRLIRLSGTAALPFPLEELVFEDRRMTTTEVLKSIGLQS